jgi:hypothetical protein
MASTIPGSFSPPGRCQPSAANRARQGRPLRDSAHNFGPGLSIVRAVAEAHDGGATAMQGPAGGASVTMWLPLYQRADGTAFADDP